MGCTHPPKPGWTPAGTTVVDSSVRVLGFVSVAKPLPFPAVASAGVRKGLMRVLARRRRVPTPRQAAAWVKTRAHAGASREKCPRRRSGAPWSRGRLPLGPRRARSTARAGEVQARILCPLLGKVLSLSLEPKWLRKTVKETNEEETNEEEKQILFFKTT